MADHFALRLVDSRMLAPSVRHLAFEREDDEPLTFVPGQFLQVHFHYDDGSATKRSYSVATVGDGSSPVRRIEIAVSFVEGGAATRLLGGLQHGASVQASGPYGRFSLQAGDTHPRYLLLATGTGVTPYRAMLPQLRRLLAGADGAHSGREAVLLYGARSEDELLYDAEFEAFAREHPGFTYHGCLSRRARAVARPHDRMGHVQSVLPELAPDAARDIAYLCGNPDMVDAAFNALKEFGLPTAQIRREKYISSR